MAKYKPQHARLLFIDQEINAGGYLKERKWHPTQRIEENSDGSAVLSLKVNHLLELKRWILSWGSMAKVLEPQSFIEDIKLTIADMKNIY